MKLTPNVKKLIIHRVSMVAIPKHGGIEAGFAFLSDKDLMVRTFKEASIWVATAIEVIRKSNDPNPFKDSTDEEIATELINRIDARKRR